MHILLTNDDGLQAQGLQILKEEMMGYARKVTVVAPAGQRSAASPFYDHQPHAVLP